MRCCAPVSGGLGILLPHRVVFAAAAHLIVAKIALPQGGLHLGVRQAARAAGERGGQQAHVPKVIWPAMLPRCRPPSRPRRKHLLRLHPAHLQLQRAVACAQRLACRLCRLHGAAEGRCQEVQRARGAGLAGATAAVDAAAVMRAACVGRGSTQQRPQLLAGGGRLLPPLRRQAPLRPLAIDQARHNQVPLVCGAAPVPQQPVGVAPGARLLRAGHCGGERRQAATVGGGRRRQEVACTAPCGARSALMWGLEMVRGTGGACWSALEGAVWAGWRNRASGVAPR